MGRPVMHFEIITKDAPELRDFYHELFDWKIDPPMPAAGLTDYTTIQTGTPVGIGGGIGAAPDGYDGHCTFYIAVDDIAAKLAEIEQRGGRSMMEPTRVPGGPEIALFTDPAGFTIGLVRP